MAAKKVAKKKPIIRKRARTVQKNVGKGPNININIDQSKKTTRKTTSQAQPKQPHIISTYTPTMAPPPPAFIPFPFPTPNLNPFESVVRETQKAKATEEPNELEKPKPKPRETSEAPIEIPEATLVFNHSQEPVQFVESFPVIEKMPIVKAIQIKPPTKHKKTSEAQTDDNEDITWFYRPRTTDTPLEQQAKSQQENILAIYEPKQKPIKAGVHTMTDLIEGRQLKINIPPNSIRNDQEFQAFTGSGNILNRLAREQAQKRPSEEELRNIRLSVFEPKVEKVINPPKEENTIIQEEPMTLAKALKEWADAPYKPVKPELLLKNEEDKPFKKYERENDYSTGRNLHYFLQDLKDKGINYRFVNNDEKISKIDENNLKSIFGEGKTVYIPERMNKTIENNTFNDDVDFILENNGSITVRTLVKPGQVRFKPSYEQLQAEEEDIKKKSYITPEEEEIQKEIDSYRKQISRPNMKVKTLKAMATKQGLKKPHPDTKTELVELLMNHKLSTTKK